MQRQFQTAIAITSAIAITLLQGCSTTRTQTAQTQTHSKPPQPVVVIFFVDGLDQQRLTELLEADKLPNIKARFVDGGVGVKHAVASIPAVTYPNAVSLLTGCFPGHHGILGNQWFDRQTFFLRDYSSLLTYQKVNTDFSNTTLYEYLSDKPTVSVRCHTRRGATKTFDHSLASGLDWARGRYEKCDRRVGLTAPLVAQHADKTGAWPSVYLSYMPGVDAIGHQQGSGTEEYRSALIVADEAIGYIIETIEKQNRNLSPYYILATDHSHVPTRTDQFADIHTWLSETTGWKIHRGAYEGTIKSWRKSHFDRYDAVLINGAYRRASIHIKGEGGWHERPSSATVERLVRPDGSELCGGLPGILLACHRENQNRVLVYTDKHTFQIDRRSELGQKQYRVTTARPDDSTNPAIKTLAKWSDGAWRSSREWLARSAATALPDFVPQIVEFFDSDRAGDVILFADDEWSFYPETKGGHGSCVAADMRIPLYFSGPDLPKGANIAVARLVDLMPTALDMLNEHHRLEGGGPIDGISLLPQLRSAIERP